jgi:hypothetical protein
VTQLHGRPQRPAPSEHDTLSEILRRADEAPVRRAAGG